MNKVLNWLDTILLIIVMPIIVLIIAVWNKVEDVVDFIKEICIDDEI